MDMQDNTPINISKSNEIQININEHELKDVSIHNNVLFPKNANISKDIDLTNEKVVKEKQGKPVQKEISINEVNKYSFQDISMNCNINNLNNQESSIKEKEPSLQKVVRVNLNDLYNNPPVMSDKRINNIRVPKSLEDWIENHSKKALEEPIVSPEKPPSYIPILETTEDLDEVITPKRSVSCRARNHATVRQIKVMNPSQNINANQTSNNINTSNNVKRHRINKQTQMIHLSDHEYVQNQKAQSNLGENENTRKSQKNIPKYQMCSYKQCEFIATDRCEKCYDPLCLNHLQRFYYSLPTFSGKNLCINCYKKTSKSYLWIYLISGFISSITLVVIFVNTSAKNYLKSGNSFWFYLCCIVLSFLTLASFVMAYLCTSLLNVNVTPFETF